MTACPRRMPLILIYSILLLSTFVIGLNDSAFKPGQNLRQESFDMDNNNMVDNLVYGITRPGQWHDSLYAHHDCVMIYIGVVGA